MAESNRFNVLASIVKDHLNAKLRQKERYSHRAATGHRTDSIPTPATAAARAPRGERSAANPHGRHPPSRPRVTKVDRGSSRPTARTAVPARTPGGGGIKATVTIAAVVASHSPMATEAQNKWQRLLAAPTLPTLAHNPSQGVSSSSAGISLGPAPHPLPPPVSQGAPPAAAAAAPPRREVPGKHGGGMAQPLGLPPLHERYGSGVVASWAQAPLALRLGRRRCQSVAIAELDRGAYEEYMEGVLRPRASDRQQRLASPEGGGGETGKGRRCEGKGRGRRGGGAVGKKGEEGEGDAGSSTKKATKVKPRMVGGSKAVPGNNRSVGNIGVAEGEHASNRPRSPAGATGEGPAATGATPSEMGGFDQASDPSRLKGRPLAESLACTSDHSPNRDSVGEHSTAHKAEPCSASVSNMPVNPRHQLLVSLASGEFPSTAKVSPSTFLQSYGGDTGSSGGRGGRGDGGGDGGRGKRHGSTRAPALDGRASSKTLPAADTLTSTALTFRSGDARKVFKQTERLLESLRTPARSSSIGRMDHGGVGRDGLGKDGRPSAVVVRYQPAGERGMFVGDRDPDRLGVAETWRGTNKPGDRLARLAEVFRCVAPPHTVRIECVLHLHDAMGMAERGGGDRDAGGRGGGGGRVAAAGGDRGGMWDDFVLAWEVRVPCVYIQVRVAVGVACNMRGSMSVVFLHVMTPCSVTLRLPSLQNLER